MNWTGMILSGVLSALLGGLGSLGLAAGCVHWYRISSFEGKSGFFIVGVTLLGIAGGALVGVIAARAAASA